MKKYIIILFLFISVFIKVNAQSATFNALNAIDFNSYVDKPVDSFLHVIPQNYTFLKIVGHVDSPKAYYLFILYPDTSQVTIQVKRYQYMNPIDPNRIWDINLYKKENLHYISLFHNDYGFKDALGN